MAAAHAGEKHEDEWGLTWYLWWGIYTSIPTSTHTQNSLAVVQPLSLTLFKMGFFEAADREEGGGGEKKSPPPPCLKYDTYPAMMKLGSYTLRNEDPKIIWITWHTSSVLLTSAFYTGISKFCYIKKYRHRFHLGTSFLILLNFLESLRIVLINMPTIVMSAKMDTPVLLKIKCFFFKKKVYDIIVFVHDVTNKILSHDSNYNANVVVWPKFGNSSISVREVIIT